MRLDCFLLQGPWDRGKSLLAKWRTRKKKTSLPTGGRDEIFLISRPTDEAHKYWFNSKICHECYILTIESNFSWRSQKANLGFRFLYLSYKDLVSHFYFWAKEMKAFGKSVHISQSYRQIYNSMCFNGSQCRPMYFALAVAKSTFKQDNTTRNKRNAN